MMAGGKKGSLMSDINVTPFVDVMLVLLIIFMVTAPMMVQGVNVALPEATTRALPTDETQLMVSLDKEGRVFLNDLELNIEDLSQKLVKVIESNPDQQVYLKADKDVTYGDVVQVMAAVKAAGVENLGMVTIPVKEKKKP